MRRRNTLYTGHMTDMETDQHGMNYIHPEPCVVYGGIANFSYPQIPPLLPAPGSTSNLVMHHHPPGHHENAFFYGPQHPATTLDFTSSNPYNLPYMISPYVSRDFPVPGGHGAHEQIPFSSTQVVGIHPDHYFRSYPDTDGARDLFKRKNAEGFHGGLPHHDAAAASSSFVGRESDIALMVPTNFAPPDQGNETSSSIIENESHMSARNRTGSIGSDSVPAHIASHLVQGNYVGPPFQLHGNPWLDMQLRNNGGGNDASAWNQAPPLPYLPGNIGGGHMEAGVMAIHGYQMTANSGNSVNVLHHPLLPNVHPPLPPVLGARGHSINFPSQVTSSRSTPINALQGVVEAMPRPVPPTGFRLYTPHRRDHFVINARHRNFPHLRVLPEDGVAMLEVPGYHEVLDAIDQHRDMRLDIDHMSYEELLALGEQIGSVASGVSEEIVVGHLKTRSFVSHVNSSDQEETASGDRSLEFCVICQNEYKDQDNVGAVDCGHEYHVDCIKKWLLEKNSCPICKSTALKTERKEL